MMKKKLVKSWNNTNCFGSRITSFETEQKIIKYRTNEAICFNFNRNFSITDVHGKRSFLICMEMSLNWEAFSNSWVSHKQNLFRHFFTIFMHLTHIWNALLRSDWKYHKYLDYLINQKFQKEIIKSP